jgi:hypothetical protein
MHSCSNVENWLLSIQNLFHNLSSCAVQERHSPAATLDAHAGTAQHAVAYMRLKEAKRGNL